LIFEFEEIAYVDFAFTSCFPEVFGKTKKCAMDEICGRVGALPGARCNGDYFTGHPSAGGR
jgi:hypothetical protein